VTDTQRAVSYRSTTDGQLHTRPEPDSFRRTTRALARSWWIILLCGVVALAAGIGVAQRQSKSYSASTYLLLSTQDFQQAVAGGYTSITPQTQEATAISYLTPPRKAVAARQAGIPAGASYGVTITPVANSNVLPIQATADTPREAAALANAATGQMVAVLRDSNEAQLRQARAVLHSQVAAAPTKNQKRALTAQLNSLATLKALADNGMQIIQRAQPPSVTSSPSKARIGAISLLLGLLVGVAIAMLRRERIPAAI
jgi:uncharacterized protein involved in exopolysaccharide biosynthesis